MPVVHNRGKRIGDKLAARKIIFPKAWDEKGQPVKDGKVLIEEILLPGAHKTVTDEQLKHLKENFGDEIVNIDDVKDMQSHFKAAAPEKPREGYVAPDEVNDRVEKRVQEELAKRGADDKEGGEETREELIARIDAMDRNDLIALIEKEGLGIEHKGFKAPGTLKAAVLTALENKSAAKTEAA